MFRLQSYDNCAVIVADPSLSIRVTVAIINPSFVEKIKSVLKPLLL